MSGFGKLPSINEGIIFLSSTRSYRYIHKEKLTMQRIEFLFKEKHQQATDINRKEKEKSRNQVLSLNRLMSNNQFLGMY